MLCALSLVSASSRAQSPAPVAVNTVLLAPTVLAAAGDVAVPTGGQAAMGLTLQGTYTGLTAAVQGQITPGGSWATIPAVPFGGAAAVTSISANGFWTINAAPYVAIRLHVTALASGSAGVVFGGASPLAITVVNPDGTSVGGCNNGQCPSRGSGAYSTATVGTTASAIVGASAATQFIDIINASGAYLCLSLGGTPTITGAQCGGTGAVIPLPPGWHRSWPEEGLFLPTDAISAISAGSTLVTIGVK